MVTVIRTLTVPTGFVVYSLLIGLTGFQILSLVQIVQLVFLKLNSHSIPLHGVLIVINGRDIYRNPTISNDGILLTTNNKTSRLNNLRLLGLYRSENNHSG